MRVCCFEGLGMKEYNSSQGLQDFFKVVSLSVDKGDVTYISTLEGRKVRLPHHAPTAGNNCRSIKLHTLHGVWSELRHAPHEMHAAPCTIHFPA